MARLLKVLFWMNSPAFGGTEQMNLRIIRTMNTRDFLVDVLFFKHERADLLTDYRGCAAEVRFIEELGWLRTFRTLSGYDVIYAFGLKGNLLARLYKLIRPSVKVVSSLHAIIPHADFSTAFPVYLDKLTYRLGDAYVSNSASSIEYLQERFGYPKKYQVIEHGVDVGKLAAYQPQFNLKERFGFPKDSIIITCVGSFKPVKNQEMLLRALSLCDNDSVRTLLVGKGPRLNDLIKMTDDFGLSDTVRFLTAEPDVLSILKQSDMFISCSRAEGLPGALMEAMACGVPVIATEVYGNNQLVKNGVTGIAVPLDNAAALADAIKHYVANRGFAEKLGVTGKHYIEEKFNLKLVVERTEAMLRTVTGSIQEPK